MDLSCAWFFLGFFGFFSGEVMVGDEGGGAVDGGGEGGRGHIPEMVKYDRKRRRRGVRESKTVRGERKGGVN